MNLNQLSVFLFAVTFVSCAPQYARMTRYVVDEPYVIAQQKLIRFHQTQSRPFTLIHDEIRTEMIETIPGKETTFLTKRWAMDIGTKPQYKVTLEAQNGDSVVIGKELPDPRMIYDGSRAISGNKLGRLAALDQWIQNAMSLKHRMVGEDKESAPLYHLH
jgi:hypothetical protein